jgi:integrase
MSSRKSRGEGELIRNPGRRVWMMRFYAPGPDGKMIQVKETTGTADERAARNKLKDRLAAVRLARKTGGTVELPVNRRVTVAELLDEYLADLRLREKKSAFGERYRLGKDSPLRAELGHVLASSLSHASLVAYVEKRRTRDKSSNATINRDLEGLRAALRLAERTGRVFRVPHIPEKLRGRVRQGFFSAEEVGRLVKAAEESSTWLAEMILFAYATGWRRGELLGLTWAMVDLDEREIRLAETKNGEGRVVAIAGELAAIMDRLVKARAVKRHDNSVMLSETVFHDDAQPITRKRFILAWTAARKAAKLPGRLFHDFRRSAARRHIAAGVSQAVAMRITGHKTPSMFRRYQIVEKDDVARALEQVASRKEAATGARVVTIKMQERG